MPPSHFLVIAMPVPAVAAAMRAAVMVEVGMVMAVMLMVAVFLAVPMLTTEAVREDRLMDMAMATLLSPTEKKADLVLIQQVEHILPGKEDVAHARNGMGIHDRGRYILIGSHRHEDRTAPHHGWPVLIAQRMAEAYGRGKSLFPASILVW